MLKDPYEPKSIKLSVIQVLATLGDSARPALPALEVIQRSTDPELKQAASSVLSSWQKLDAFLVTIHSSEIEKVKAQILDLESMGLPAFDVFDKARATPNLRKELITPLHQAMARVLSESSEAARILDGLLTSPDQEHRALGKALRVQLTDDALILRYREREKTSGQSKTPPRLSLPVGGNFPGVEVSPDGKHIVTWTRDVHMGFMSAGQSQSHLRIYDLTTGKELLHRVDSFEYTAFSHDGAYIAVCDPESVTVWRIAEARQVANLQVGSPGIVYFSRDDDLLVIPRGKSPLQLWDTRSWTEMPSSSNKYFSGTSLSTLTTSDGRFAATLTFSEAETSPTLKIWELSTGNEMPTPDELL